MDWPSHRPGPAVDRGLRHSRGWAKARRRQRDALCPSAMQYCRNARASSVARWMWSRAAVAAASGPPAATACWMRRISGMASSRRFAEVIVMRRRRPMRALGEHPTPGPRSSHCARATRRGTPSSHAGSPADHTGAATDSEAPMEVRIRNCVRWSEEQRVEGGRAHVGDESRDRATGRLGALEKSAHGRATDAGVCSTPGESVIRQATPGAPPANRMHGHRHKDGGCAASGFLAMVRVSAYMPRTVHPLLVVGAFSAVRTAVLPRVARGSASSAVCLIGGARPFAEIPSPAGKRRVKEHRRCCGERVEVR